MTATEMMELSAGGECNLCHSEKYHQYFRKQSSETY